MGKGSIKIASTQNAIRQLNWLPTYTLFENMKLIDFKIINNAQHTVTSTKSQLM